jgi:hypothetical protein
MGNRIIVADHDDTFRSDLVTALQDAGYAAESVGDGSALVEQVRLHPPDLLIWGTRMEMDTFKSLDPWSPRSPLASVPTISIGVPSPLASESGWLESVGTSNKPLLMGRRPISCRASSFLTDGC